MAKSSMVKQTTSQYLGRRGERWFVNQLPDSWIFQFPSEDIGIDGVVVIGEPGLLNGSEFRVQVKTRRSWEKTSDKIVLRNVKRSAVRYWASGLTLTMLALFEADNDTGHYFWVRDLFDDPLTLFTGKTHTITLRVPMTHPIIPSCWTSVRERLTEYYRSLSTAFSAASIASNLFEILHSLLEFLRALQFAQFTRLSNTDEQERLLTL